MNKQCDVCGIDIEAKGSIINGEKIICQCPNCKDVWIYSVVDTEEDIINGWDDEI